MLTLSGVWCYQLDDSHVEYNKEFPLGEGNFGVVYKGVRTKSDGDWEEVAIKEIKETDTMSSQAHDDMEREVNLIDILNMMITPGEVDTILAANGVRENAQACALKASREKRSGSFQPV